MADHVEKILNYYTSDMPGTKTNIARLLKCGKLARASTPQKSHKDPR